MFVLFITFREEKHMCVTKGVYSQLMKKWWKDLATFLAIVKKTSFLISIRGSKACLRCLISLSNSSFREYIPWAFKANVYLCLVSIHLAQMVPNVNRPRYWWINGVSAFKAFSIPPDQHVKERDLSINFLLVSE